MCIFLCACCVVSHVVAHSVDRDVRTFRENKAEIARLRAELSQLLGKPLVPMGACLCVRVRVGVSHSEYAPVFVLTRPA